MKEFTPIIIAALATVVFLTYNFAADLSVSRRRRLPKSWVLREISGPLLTTVLARFASTWMFISVASLPLGEHSQDQNVLVPFQLSVALLFNYAIVSGLGKLMKMARDSFSKSMLDDSPSVSPWAVLLVSMNKFCWGGVIAGYERATKRGISYLYNAIDQYPNASRTPNVRPANGAGETKRVRKAAILVLWERQRCDVMEFLHNAQNDIELGKSPRNVNRAAIMNQPSQMVLEYLIAAISYELVETSLWEIEASKRAIWRNSRGKNLTSIEDDRGDGTQSWPTSDDAAYTLDAPPSPELLRSHPHGNRKANQKLAELLER